MHDLRLWELLATESFDPGECAELLQELAELPLRDRFPWFGRIDSAILHRDARVRAASLSVLAEANGLTALRWIVRALDDDDQDVRRAAVEALRKSSAAAPPRWVHALFHPNSDVRRVAMEGSPVGGAEWYSLFLLADSECHQLAAKAITSARVHLPPRVLPTIFGFLRREILTRAEARRLIAEMRPADIDQWLSQTLQRTDRQVEAILSDTASPMPTREPIQQSHDVLDDVLDLYWDREAEREADASTGWCPQSTFFDELAGALYRSEMNSPRVVAAVLATAHRRGYWIGPSAELCAVNWPLFLAVQSIPRDVRHASIRGIYGMPDRCRKLTSEMIAHLLDADVCRRPSGNLDLWAIGGVLHFARHKPIELLVETFGIEQIVAAFLESPEQSAPLFLLRDYSEHGQQYLITQISQRRPARRAFFHALLVHSVSTDAVGFLESLTSKEAMETASELVRLSTRSEMRLNDNKIRVIGEIFGPKLRTKIRDFLRSWLALDQPEEWKLGLEILGNLARLADAADIVSAAGHLDPPALRKLLRAVAWCSGFPHGKEVQLAIALAAHRDAEVRQWAQSRQPHSGARATAGTHIFTGARGRRIVNLSAPARRAIATCRDDELPDRLEQCRELPHRGLCSALADRTAFPSVAACVALMGSHDPIADVDQQLIRFSTDEAVFESQLDDQVVATWESVDALPLPGHAWLWRWERHALAVAEQWTSSDEGMVELLRMTKTLCCGLLVRPIWQLVGRVLGIWRYRDRERLGRLFTPSLAQLLVDELSAEYGPHAAGALMRLHQIEPQATLLATIQPAVFKALPGLPSEVRTVLTPWIDSRGLVTATAPARAPKTPLDADLRGRIANCFDYQQLNAWCQDENRALVEDAALRLVELAEEGQSWLAKLLQVTPPIRCYDSIVSTISLWSDGPSLETVRRMARGEKLAPEHRFRLVLELMARGEDCWLEDAVRPCCQETDHDWFRQEDWQRLVELGISPRELSIGLAASPHPFAYTQAVALLLEESGPNVIQVIEALRRFLRCGTRRPRALRRSVARWLHDRRDFTGLPLLLQQCAEESVDDTALLARADEQLVQNAVSAVLVGGNAAVGERLILGLLDEEVDPLARNDAFERILRDASDLVTRESVVAQLRRPGRRYGKLRRVAETFAWGVRMGRELTGRLFTVEMIGNEDLGYTRFEQNRIYINPLPILRREKHGDQLVEALILHELGHHIYHRGQREQEVWKEAQEDRLHSMLNLVSDEHLERNLRAKDRDFGDRLKRLCAYAFQYSTNEVPVERLLDGLQHHALDVLVASKLAVARDPNCVAVENGQLLREMERAGLSFARFFRALRMGLGDRYDDPKVTEALSLFKQGFRRKSMDDLLQIARRLREIFGAEALILESFKQDTLLGADPGETLIHGEGITGDQLQDEIRRITDPRELRRRGDGSKEGGGRAINVTAEKDFNPITTVVHVAYDRQQHREISERVARHAKRMRQYLQQLGITLYEERYRVSGRRLDPARVRDLVVRRDPRVLIARRAKFSADLFLAVIIDCSGSMTYNDNIQRAKLFSVMLADAAKGLRGIDLRIFGFTDEVIYDAGDAERPAVHGLEAGGGNNDSAALWHAAQIARSSSRRAKLLVMISDGLPTECSVDSLRSLVRRLTHRMNICCAQVAVQPLEEICFPHYVLVEDDELETSVRTFGEVIARLVRTAITR